MESDRARQAIRASTGQLLLRAARLLDERAVARVNASPDRPAGVELRPAHTRLFPHIPLAGGVRATDLARLVGVTKQAVQPLIAELEAWGIVALSPDPTDGRARLVGWTPFGLESIHRGLAVLRQIEDEIAAKIGSDRIDTLNETLTRVVAVLEHEP